MLTLTSSGTIFRFTSSSTKEQLNNDRFGSDINYKSRLWFEGRRANHLMSEYAEQVKPEGVVGLFKLKMKLRVQEGWLMN